MHIPVCCDKLLSVYFPIATIAILKICVYITIRICAVENTNCVHGGTISVFAGIGTCYCTIAPSIVYIICSALCRISICEKNNDSISLTRIYGIFGKNIVCGIQTSCRSSIASWTKSINSICDCRQTTRSIHVDKAICQICCIIRESHNSNTVIYVIAATVLSIGAFRFLCDTVGKLVHCNLEGIKAGS